MQFSTLPGRQRGIILPLTLIIIAVLIIMGSILLKRNATLIEQAQMQRDRWQARLKINDAEQRLFFTFLAGIEEPAAFRLGDVQLRLDGTPVELSNGVTVSIQDQAGLLSVRYLRPALIEQWLRAFMPVAQAQNVTARITAFQQRPQGDRPARESARQAMMRSQDELLLIEGITPELYNSSPALLSVDETDNVKKTLKTSQVPPYLRPQHPYGLKDILMLSGSSRLNYAAMPTVLLKGLYNLTDADIERLNRLKRQSNWSAVKSTLRHLGLSNVDATLPSSRYIIRYQYKGIIARGDYRARTLDLPPKRRSWYFPDQYRNRITTK
jgi:hypothetical protein